MAYETDGRVDLIGSSKSIHSLRQSLCDLAQSTATVLFIGETGSGKDVAARYLHACNPLGPFVLVDCGALQETLLASELFGYERGAFTGAVRHKPGLFEVADNGTLFLDEIGELGFSEQKQLLTVLDTKQVRRLGSIQSRKLNFRLLAATNRDLKKDVSEGRFREDLYYRLNVIKLRVPPLRERLEDIPALVEHFLSECGYPHRLSKESVRLLSEYSWPGNIRQLRACVERMMATAGQDTPDVAHLPETIRQDIGVRPASWAQTDEQAADKEQTRTAMTAMLKETQDNRAEAARRLGIGRSTLYRHLRRIGLSTRGPASL